MMTYNCITLLNYHFTMLKKGDVYYMNNQLLHTPDGVRDIYSTERARKTYVERALLEQFLAYGYQQIQTPTFEFFDIFNQECGSVPSTELYKFFDRNNNTLVLRPDITPSIARCAAKYFSSEQAPLRFSYLGSTFINSESFQGRLKESTQSGVELIGDCSVDADAEMIALAIESLKASGLEEFQIEIGQVDFFRGLLEASDMDYDTKEQLRTLIESKNFFGVEELLLEQNLPKHLEEAFLLLPELFGDIDKIKSAKAIVKNETSLKAIQRLEKIQELLDIYELGEYVSYDLGMLSKFSYYTGIIFKAYTYGLGDYIINGGRYDKLLHYFGNNSAAVGFAIEIDRLMLALNRQNLTLDVDKISATVIYQDAYRKQGIQFTKKLRSIGQSVSLMQMTQDEAFYINECKKSNIATLYLIYSSEVIEKVSITTNHRECVSVLEWEVTSCDI